MVKTDPINSTFEKQAETTVTHRVSCTSQENLEACSPTHNCCNNLQIKSPANDTFHIRSLSQFNPHLSNRGPYIQGSKTEILHKHHPDTSTDSTVLPSVSSLISTSEVDSIEIPSEKKQRNFINFSILELFSKSGCEGDLYSRNYYKPANHTGFFGPHRPLVPQSILQSTAEIYNDEFSACFIRKPTGKEGDDGEKGFVECITKYGFDDEILEKVEEEGNCHHTERRMSFSMDRFVFFDSQSELKKQGPTLSSLLSNGETFENLFNTDNTVWWLDCLDPTPTEIKTIGRTFGIHPLTLDDIKPNETREKVELFQSYYFLCFNTFNNDKEAANYLKPINIYLVVFREGVISFHFTPISHPSNVRRRVGQLRNYVNVSSDWLCYAILNDITDCFEPIVKKLEIEIDYIEESVYLTRKPDFNLMILRIGENRNIVNLVLRLLSRKADVIKMFSKRCDEQYTNAPREEIVLYLEDIQDHIIAMKESLAVYEKMLSRSHSNYLAQLQVESVDSNNRVTKVLGRVTLIGTVLVPLNLVTGVFGMNVRVPGQNGDDLKWFFGVIGFIVAMIIVFSLIANHWIVEAESGGDISASDQAAPVNKKLRKAAKRLNPFFHSSNNQTFDKVC